MRQLTVIGNIGQDAQDRMSATSGKGFFTFSVADNTREKTVWVNCICYRFEGVKPYIKKGRQVMVQGSFDIQVFKDAPDITLYVDNLELLGKREDDAKQQGDVTFAQQAQQNTKEDTF